MTDIINLADHRPPAPPRPSRITRLARWSDDTLCTLVVAAGLCTVAWLPGHALKWIAAAVWSDVPWYLDVFLVGAPGVLVVMWATLAGVRLQRSEPDGCSINVHVFEDEVAGKCKCGATGDVDGDAA
jgi:hypothetical protein